MDENEQLELRKQTLCRAAHLYAKTSPQLSAFFMNQVAEMPVVKGQKNLPEHSVCRKCGTLFRPGNHSVRVRPKMKQSKKISRLLKRQLVHSNQNVRISRYMRHILDMYETEGNRLVYKCTVCNERTIIRGEKRKPFNLDGMEKSSQGNNKTQELHSTPKSCMSWDQKIKGSTFISPSTSTPMNAPHQDISSKKHGDRSASQETSSINLHSKSNNNHSDSSHNNSLNFSLTPDGNNSKKRQTPSRSHRNKSLSITPNRGQTPPTFGLTGSSGSNSTKRKKEKKAMHQRLQEILRKEDKRKNSENSQNNSLHNFLSSL